ncbi:MAG TPA: hypothetical protein VHK89_00200, partial [Actinomycetota bacterium]|nr:hypothetical protein [Actinomycetota bacterium]
MRRLCVGAAIVMSIAFAACEPEEPPRQQRRARGTPDPHSPGGRSCSSPPSYARPGASRPRYSLHLDVEPEAGRVRGRLEVAFAPDRPTDRLVF